MMNKTGRYTFLAEPFHCDFQRRLFASCLGNDMLNAAEYHSRERGFGMDFLNPLGLTWVLSRLSIEMDEMPRELTHYDVETWCESAMRYFTKRNFRICDTDTSRTLGYGRSVWAMIDTTRRTPADILAVKDGEIVRWAAPDEPCPIAPCNRITAKAEAEARTVEKTMNYSDVDVNGHVNSVKYIEHILDAFSLDWHRSHKIRRLDIAYVAESHAGDTLTLSVSQPDEETYVVIVTRPADSKRQEVVRAKIRASISKQVDE